MTIKRLASEHEINMLAEKEGNEAKSKRTAQQKVQHLDHTRLDNLGLQLAGLNGKRPELDMLSPSVLLARMPPTSISSCEHRSAGINKVIWLHWQYCGGQCVLYWPLDVEYWPAVDLNAMDHN